MGRRAEAGRAVMGAAESVDRGRDADPDDDRRRSLDHALDRHCTLRAMPARPDTNQVPERIRRLGRVHHVAVVVREMEPALRFWRDTLGLELEVVEDMAHDRVRIAFLPVGESKVELVEPTDDTTGVARFLEKSGEGFHHVCFEVANLAETLLRLEIDGIELIDTAPRKGAEGPVAFLHPRSCHGVLVELIEAPGGPAWSSLGYRYRDGRRRDAPALELALVRRDEAAIPGGYEAVLHESLVEFGSNGGLDPGRGPRGPAAGRGRRSASRIRRACRPAGRVPGDVRDGQTDPPPG